MVILQCQHCLNARRASPQVNLHSMLDNHRIAVKSARCQPALCKSIAMIQLQRGKTGSDLGSSSKGGAKQCCFVVSYRRWNHGFHTIWSHHLCMQRSSQLYDHKLVNRPCSALMVAAAAAATVTKQQKQQQSVERSSSDA